MNEAVPMIPTREQLESQLTGLVVQRSQLKDQVEQIEKQMPSIASMVQLLTAQEKVAEEKAVARMAALAEGEELI